MTDVIVVDKSYLCGGASGRNGGGVRAQWSSEANVRLMQESIRMCRDFAAKMKINVWFRQGGYLFLARTEQRCARARGERASCRTSAACRRACSRPPRRARSSPSSTPTASIAASYNPDDGVVFPWPFVWGFAQAAQKLGVEVRDVHEVVGFETTGARIDGVRRRRDGAAGASGAPRRDDDRDAQGRERRAARGRREVARMLGVELPNKPHRHEICSTEPLKPWLKPLVADLSDGLYFSQSTRGEIVGGIGQRARARGARTSDSSHAFLGKYARVARPRLPGARGREGAAPVGRAATTSRPTRTPSSAPVDEVEDFYPGVRLHGARLHDGARRREADRGDA